MLERHYFICAHLPLFGSRPRGRYLLGTQMLLCLYSIATYHTTLTNTQLLAFL
jgi:hypothetical protein